MLLDSNIIIYAARPEHQRLRDFIEANFVAVSAIAYVEVLGYWRLKDPEDEILRRLLDSIPSLSINNAVVREATLLRRLHHLCVGDAIIARPRESMR